MNVQIGENRIREIVERCIATIFPKFIEVQFSSVAQLCPTLCNPMNCSTPGLPVHHQLPESTQTHIHCVGDAIQSSHLLSSPSPSVKVLHSVQFSSVSQSCLTLCNTMNHSTPGLPVHHQLPESTQTHVH